MQPFGLFIEEEKKMTLGFKEIRIEEEPVASIVTLVIEGKLEKKDYEAFTPQLEQYLERMDKVRLLVELRDFKGFSTGAMWEDAKFGAKHFNDIDRLAVVGDKAWEKAMAAFAKPFTSAKVRYFDESQISEARQWITEEDDKE
jgi:hypothetical protein